MKKEKKFLIPDIEIIEFNDKDVIVTSGESQEGDMGEVPLGSIPF